MLGYHLKPIWLTLIYVTSNYTYFLLCHKSPSILSKIISFYSVKNYINSLFHLAQMAAILDFINNTMSKVLSDYITMSGTSEARMLDTKMKNMRLFCRK